MRALTEAAKGLAAKVAEVESDESTGALGEGASVATGAQGEGASEAPSGPTAEVNDENSDTAERRVAKLQTLIFQNEAGPQTCVCVNSGV